MTVDRQWDYEKLQHGISLLEEAKDRLRASPALPSIIEWGCRDIQHVIDFIEYNIREGEILSPAEIYLTQK